MEEKVFCRITLTGLKGREWQGSVYLPDHGRRLPFQNLIELIRTVECQRPPENPGRQSPGT